MKLRHKFVALAATLAMMGDLLQMDLQMIAAVTVAEAAMMIAAAFQNMLLQFAIGAVAIVAIVAVALTDTNGHHHHAHSH